MEPKLRIDVTEYPLTIICHKPTGRHDWAIMQFKSIMTDLNNKTAMNWFDDCECFYDRGIK